MGHFAAEHVDHNLSLLALPFVRSFVVEFDAMTTRSEVVDPADESAADDGAIHSPREVLIPHATGAFEIDGLALQH
jgi:hypothetical protein